MKAAPAWIKSMTAEAQVCKARMPWERGLRRAAMIARRVTAAQPAKRTPDHLTNAVLRRPAPRLAAFACPGRDSLNRPESAREPECGSPVDGLPTIPAPSRGLTMLHAQRSGSL